MPTPPTEILSGWLKKRSRIGHYQSRFFLLDNQNLTYYKQNGQVVALSLNDFKDVTKTTDNTQTHEFALLFSGSAKNVFPERRLHLRPLKPGAAADDEARAWADAILYARKQYEFQQAQRAADSPASYSPQPASSSLPPLAPPPLAPPPLAPPPLDAPQLHSPPPPPPVPPPPPSTPAALASVSSSTPEAPASAKPMAFEDMVRRQLRRKANAIIVERRAEVLRLVAEIRDASFDEPARVSASVAPRGTDGTAALRLSITPYDPAAATVSWWGGVVRQLEELQLPLECEKDETWGSRLEIPKRGGGEHFSPAERAVAAEAYRRVSAIYDYVSVTSQLSDRARQCETLAETLFAQRELSQAKTLEKYSQLNEASIQLATRCTSSDGKALRRRCEAAMLPDSLDASIGRLCAALPALLRQALQMAAEDWDGWRATAPASKKRFRTPRTHALHVGVLAMVDAQLAAKASASLAPLLNFSEDLETCIELAHERKLVLDRAQDDAAAALAEELDDAI